MEKYHSRFNDYQFQTINKFFLIVLFFCSAIFSASAQSTNQNFPTAVTTNEISGQIRARDIGDARLTNYFYTFNGNQGDVFVNVQTSNFNGDIDIFAADNLRPLTKITIYADATSNETGRVVYLRQPTKLILRIQGRSPNDAAATFQIKFAGSFEAAQATAENPASEMPEVKSVNQSDVRVNSVGTIIEVKPKPTPTPRATIAKKETKTKTKKPVAAPENNKESKEIAAVETPPAKSDVEVNTPEEKKETETATKSSEIENKPAPTVIVTENNRTETPKTEIEKPAEEIKNASTEKKNQPTKRRSSTNRVARSNVKAKTPKVEVPNPLANVHLIILLKDGTRIERAMSEVVKVGVDRGVLTVISNDGAIKRYQILDVAKMTIE